MVWVWRCLKDHLPWSSSRAVHTNLHRDELGAGPVSLTAQILGLSQSVQWWFKNNVGIAEKKEYSECCYAVWSMTEIWTTPEVLAKADGD